MNRWPELADLSERFSKPLEPIAWAAIVVCLLLTWQLPLAPIERLGGLLLCLFGSAYALAFFRWLDPRRRSRLWVQYLSAAVNIALVSYALYLLRPYGIQVDLFFVVIVVAAGITVGFPLAAVAATLSALAHALVGMMQGGVSFLFWDRIALEFLVFLTAGFLASSLSNVIARQKAGVDRQNRNLALLLDTGTIAASSLDLRVTLPNLAEKIARGVPLTFCRICLLDADQTRLKVAAAFPLRPLLGWEPNIDRDYALADLACHQKAMLTQQVVMIRSGDPSLVMDEKEKQALFFRDFQSACLVPLASKDTVLGVLSLGEARRWNRSPFDSEKLTVLRTLGAQIAVLISNSQLHAATHQQAEKLAALNHVAQAIGSTIELDRVLNLIYEELSHIIATDTYYVALYDAADNAWDMQVLIDEGQRFPPARHHAGYGLASLVLKNREPLLIRHLSVESSRLPFQTMTVGQNKLSESWLGVPLMIREEFIGVLALGSYQPNAFDEQDVAFMGNVARQAAMCIDNARHHAQVEEQARRDSLTGVYNHGSLLEFLQDRIERARVDGRPLSLVMLDIDHFKDYNDRYGHALGDQVLRLIVQAVRAHVKRTDIVGRWGGEEFAIALVGASSQQASRVAERVRKTLSELSLTDREGRPLPKPTVSQGIAAFPEHASGPDELVDCADRALYQAKSRGRDQIQVAGESPISPAQE